MTNKILFLDLDRTLFDTTRFMRDLWQAIGQIYNVNPQHQLAELPEWYHQMGELRYYHFEEHVQAVLHQNADQVATAVRPLLADKNFLYPDVAELSKWQKRADYQIRILSFGGDWFQKFKISFCPDIADLPRDIILEAKNIFIARTFAGAQGFLVDDKRNPDLPPGFTEVWIDRQSDVQKIKKDGIIIINSLTQVQEVL